MLKERIVVIEKIILGVDPGTTVMGFGIIEVVKNQMRFVQMNELLLSKYDNHYLKLKHIFERTTELIDTYHPDELAIEAPFFGKNVQSMLKLGRAQGVAIAAAMSRQIPIHEYAPLRIKQAITGNGQASKEQVAEMMKRMLHLRDEQMLSHLDATDALAAAYCHYLQSGHDNRTEGAPRSWKSFVNCNQNRVSSGLTGPQQRLAAALAKTNKKV